MKKFTLSLLLAIILSLSVFSQNVLTDFQYVTFYNADVGPFVEVYISVNGSTVQYQAVDDNKFEGAVNYTILFKKGEEIVDFAKQTLKSPIVADTSNINFNFLDVKRFPISNGDYEIVFSIADATTPDKEFSGSDHFSITYDNVNVSVSGIELVESFTETTSTNSLSKNGFDIVPKIFTFYPQEENRISFYCEIYNTVHVKDADSGFLLNYYIEEFESKKKIENFAFSKREKSKEVNVLFNSIDISKLPSGNYSIVVEARNKFNKLIGYNSLFFMRSNPSVEYSTDALAAINYQGSFVERITGRDTLIFCIEALRPIAGNLDKQFIDHQVKEQDNEVLRKFLLSFWLDQDSSNPEEAWRKYMASVKEVEDVFSTPTLHGFEADRGRVYLQYGPPNTIVDRSFDAGSPDFGDSGSVPYQIWHYYELGTQRNRKFVFCSPDFVNSYDLIHSDAQGEGYNPQWQTMLRRNVFNSSDNGDNFKGESGRYYYTPY